MAFSGVSCNDSDFYLLDLPPRLTCILKDYINLSKLIQLFDHCITCSPRSFLSDVKMCTRRWHVRRRPFHPSDMYWISPSDATSHQELLSVLGSGGFEAVLKQIASVLPSHAKHLTVYQLSFMVLSYCQSADIHVDFDDSLSGITWSVIIPVILVNNSPPKLLVKHTISGAVHEWKYELGQALVWGPKTEHSTAVVQYNDGVYRMCLSINLAFFCPGNVRVICSDISQQYPPRRTNFLLAWAKNPHWQRMGSNHCVTSLPQFSNEALLGAEWCQKYNELLSVIDTTKASPSLRQWMAHQRYCYSLKHGNRCVGDEDMCKSKSVLSYSRTLTWFREFMLQQISFRFTCDRDEGVNQAKWLVMYAALQDYYMKHGNCAVSRQTNAKLYLWIRRQRQVLGSCESTNSSVKKSRRDMLLALGCRC